jgi:hypothetical protein
MQRAGRGLTVGRPVLRSTTCVAFFDSIKHPARMSDSDEALIEAQVTRYDLARLRVGQLFVPIATISTIAARRNPGVVLYGAAFLLMGFGLFMLISAAKRLGWQPLRFESNAVSFGKSLRLEAVQVRSWTIVGRVARLYGSKHSTELRFRPGAEIAILALLRSVFGSPIKLDRRGTTRAIAIAACAAAIGLVVTGIAIAQDDKRLLFGLPVFVFGLVAVGVLSSRVAR